MKVVTDAQRKCWRELRRELCALGASPVRTKGSHEVWRFPDGETFVVVRNHVADSSEDPRQVPSPACETTATRSRWLRPRVLTTGGRSVVLESGCFAAVPCLAQEPKRHRHARIDLANSEQTDGPHGASTAR